MTGRRPLQAALAAALGALALAAAALAQAPGVSVTLDPNLAGQRSTLHVTADGQADQVNGRVPRSAVLSVQRGFRIDPRSRSARCSDQQARAFSCPAASR